MEGIKNTGKTKIKQGPDIVIALSVLLPRRLLEEGYIERNSG